MEDEERIELEEDERFSYSKLSTFKQCGFKYKLRYVDKHRVKNDTVATYFGTLVHYTEECIAKCIKGGIPIDYNEVSGLVSSVNKRNTNI